MASKARRGLSSVVTSAILLSSVAVIGGSIVAWSNANLSAYETSLTNTAATDTNQLNENLNIENIVFCTNCGTASSKNVINVTLTNTGTIPLNVTQMKVNSTAISSFYYSTSSPYSSSLCLHVSGISHTGSANGPSTCLPAEILPGQSYQVSSTLKSPAVWKSKIADTITITTARGSTFTTQASPP